MLSNKDHKKCWHCELFAGCTYCLDHHIVYVNSDRRLKDAGVRCEEGTHQVSFIEACSKAKRMLPPGSVKAYVWLHPALAAPHGQLQLHTLRDTTEEFDRRNKA